MIFFAAQPVVTQDREHRIFQGSGNLSFSDKYILRRILLMAEYKDLLEEKMTYPREDHTTSDGKAAALFVSAYAMDLANGIAYGCTQTPEVARLYSAAFDAGSIEAGVNLMRILIQTSFSVHKDGIAEDSIGCSRLKNRLTNLSERLNALGHPIVPYYNALAHIEIGNPDSGYNEMCKLAEYGNKYAITFLALADYLEKEAADEEFYEEYPDDDFYGNRPYGDPFDEYPPREY